ALDLEVERGVVVRTVDPNGPAAAAGIAPGDVVVRFDGRDVRSRSEFAERAAALTDDDPVELEVVSPDGRRVLRLRAARLTAEVVDETGWRRLGLRVGARRGPGVTVTEVRRGSVAARTGIRRGDVVLG